MSSNKIISSLTKISILIIAITYVLGLSSCTESARQSRDPRLNLDSIASSMPKSDTLFFINKEISDTNKELRYYYSCNYPELIHFENEILKRKVNYTIVNQIRDVIDMFVMGQEIENSDSLKARLPEDYELWESKNSYLFINYEIINNSTSMMSMIFNVEHYMAFNAHPISYHRTLNIDMNNGEPVDLHRYTYYIQDSMLLENISQKSFQKINKLKVSDSNWIVNGTLPVWENFRNFNIKNDSLVLTFDVYQVAPYAVGPVRIGIAWKELVNDSSDKPIK